MTTLAIRPGTPDDTSACTAVWYSTIDRAIPQPTAPYPLYQHELDSGTLLVAEAGGQVVGFAGSIIRGSRWFLADLFVSPDWHGAGTGRRLLDALLEHDAPGPRRATMASDDPAAISLYTRAGMQPRWPCFTMVAPPRRPADDHHVGAHKPTTVVTTNVETDTLLDAAEWANYSLSATDLVYWQATVPTTFMTISGPDGAGVVGGAVVRWENPFSVTLPDAIPIGPIFANDAAELPAVVRAAVAHVRTTSPERPIRLYVPGPSPAFPDLLAEGFRIDGFDLHSASNAATGELLDPSRALPSHDLL